MKNPLSLLLVTILLVTGLSATAQSESEKLDLPGDNLNLYGVMKLFQDSKTIEEFEKELNSEKSFINNLDLDGDKRVDYIRVADKVNNNIHSITLNVAVNEHENQDLAVFFVEKRPSGQVLIQLLGDEDLYGKDYFLEPTDQTFKEPTGSGYGADRTQASAKFSGANSAASWPLIKVILAPNYTIWPSPWRWGYYPAYWKSRPTQFWHYYYGYHCHWHSYYNAHFRRWSYFRNPAWYSNYYGGNFRSRSVTVKTRFTKGDYKATYSNPASAREGFNIFVKKNPKINTSRDSPPAFDRTGKPVKGRPVVMNREEDKPVVKKKPSTSKKKRPKKTTSKKAPKPTAKSSRN